MEKLVCKENTCNGCTACITICKQNAIRFIDDGINLNCRIDKNLCIDCGLCHKICPNNSSPKLSYPLQLYDFKTKTNNDNIFTSSGGFASAISYYFINYNSYVTGCIYQKEKNQFSHIVTNEKSKLILMSGSKYVKSNLDNSFKEILNLLRTNKKVLFIGTPCQVAGIKNLSKFYKLDNNLYTIDLICHGTPSQKIFFEFLSSFKFDDDIYRINFRNKGTYIITYNDYKSIYPKNCVDEYTMSFLNGAIFTENCYHCNFAQPKRIGDITLGDDWSNKKSINGLNVCIINTDKGLELFNYIPESIKFYESVSYEQIKKFNQQLNHPTNISKKRIKFCKLYKKFKFKKCIFLLYPKYYIKNILKRFF